MTTAAREPAAAPRLVSHYLVYVKGIPSYVADTLDEALAWMEAQSPSLRERMVPRAVRL